MLNLTADLFSFDSIELCISALIGCVFWFSECEGHSVTFTLANMRIFHSQSLYTLKWLHSIHSLLLSGMFFLRLLTQRLCYVFLSTRPSFHFPCLLIFPSSRPIAYLRNPGNPRCQRTMQGHDRGEEF